jgi:uncharacterized protein (TIGR00369 family)
MRRRRVVTFEAYGFLGGRNMSNEFNGVEGFEERVADSFARQAALASIGASLTSVQAGRVEILLPHNEAFTQQHGFMNAGILSTVIDSACGYAAYSLMPPEAAVLTVEFKVNLLRPAAGMSFTAVGLVKKVGRTLTVTDGELYSDTDKLIANMSATMMTILERTGLQG